MSERRGVLRWTPAAGLQLSAAIVVSAAMIAALSAVVRAQSESSASPVKTIYVGSFGTGADAGRLRAKLIQRLAKSSAFQIADRLGASDAVLEGTGQVWIKGYISTNARNPESNRQPVYGGYLSAELKSNDGQALWSYMVTPGKFAWSGIEDDLTQRLAKALLAAGEKDGFRAGPQAQLHLAGTTLSGAGATFPAPLYAKWFQSFEQVHPEVHVSYKAVGSAAGTEMLDRGAIDFAASDVGSTDAAKAPATRIASVLGAVVPIYNLPGAKRDLKLNPEALAGIYLGRIVKWDDPEIRRSNHDVDLPDARIVVLHRSDGSGTSFAWTSYLSAVSPEWQHAVGAGISPHWPTGEGSEGNEGVAEAVQKTPDSIGYVELVYAIQHQLNFAAVRNSAGEYIRADLDSLADAAKAVADHPDNLSSIANAPGKNAYPIATFTWLLVPAHISDADKKAAMIALMRWVLTVGQKDCSALGYAPLPRSVATQELEILSRLN